MAPPSSTSRVYKPPPPRPPKKEEPAIGWFVSITTYLGYAVLIAFGRVRDFFGKATGSSRYFGGNRRPLNGYAPLLHDWENFYTRRLYHRIQDCWNRPIASGPTAANMMVVQRTSKDGNCTMSLDGVPKPCLNLGSYNYLGFADDWHETCQKDVSGVFDTYHTTFAASRATVGTSALHLELERTVAEFVGKPAALVFNMGYGTNVATLPGLVGKGCLLVSDSLNHTSLVNGARGSGAVVRVFKHEDMDSLENVLRNAIAEGQPRTHRPWRKILVVVEGIYSMEGDIVNLPGIVKLAKRYKAYVYLDEAHSIGALGPTGRGACEYWGVATADIDIMMGTFTKSFGAMGGYVAGSQEFIDVLRRSCDGTTLMNAMSPAVAKQVVTAFNIISGKDGTDIGRRKLQAVRDNSNYFRKRLREIGCEVYGDPDSPIIPVMLYNPTKIAAFSRECLKRSDLERALDQIDEVTRLLKLKYADTITG